MMAAASESPPADAPLVPASVTSDAGLFGASEPGAKPGSPDDDSPAVRPADAADRCTAAEGFTIAETASCYRLGASALAWQEARSDCQAWGGDLVEIGSAEENAALAGLIPGNVWIGANDQENEGDFRWAGGEPLDYCSQTNISKSLQ